MNKKHQASHVLAGGIVLAFRAFAFVLLGPPIVVALVTDDYAGAFLFILLLAACCGGAGSDASD